MLFDILSPLPVLLSFFFLDLVFFIYSFLVGLSLSFFVSDCACVNVCMYSFIVCYCYYILFCIILPTYPYRFNVIVVILFCSLLQSFGNIYTRSFSTLSVYLSIFLLSLPLLLIPLSGLLRFGIIQHIPCSI